MKYTIYKITNKINGKIYIGKHQTKNLEDGYMGSGKLIRRAIEKHGIENFSKELLYIFDTEEEMNEKEAEMVSEAFCRRDDTYNLCAGGKGGFSYINNNGLGFGGDPSGAAKKSREISDRVLRERYGDDFRSQLINKSAMIEGLRRYYAEGNPGPFLGRTHTEETKRIIGAKNSESQRGVKTLNMVAVG